MNQESREPGMPRALFPPRTEAPAVQTVDNQISRLEQELMLFNRTRDMRCVIGCLLDARSDWNSQELYFRDLHHSGKLWNLSAGGIKIVSEYPASPQELEDMTKSAGISTPPFSGSIRLHYWSEPGFVLKIYERQDPQSYQAITPFEVNYSKINDLNTVRSIERLMSVPFAALLDPISVYEAPDGKITPAIFADMANRAVATFLGQRYEHNPAVLKK
jgi:hypothetical protein